MPRRPLATLILAVVAYILGRGDGQHDSQLALAAAAMRRGNRCGGHHADD